MRLHGMNDSLDALGIHWMNQVKLGPAQSPPRWIEVHPDDLVDPWLLLNDRSNQGPELAAHSAHEHPTSAHTDTLLDPLRGCSGEVDSSAPAQGSHVL
jgi:hypothetical protein